MKTQKHSSFAAGAAMLALSGVAVKLIGVCYKIPLLHLLGAEGMGYFNTAYDVYALLCVISTTGLPVAVSVVINRYPKQHKRIFMLSLGVFAMLGIGGAAVAFFGADRIARWVGAPAAAQSLRFIAPAVLFVCLSGALRGYYQAKRNMMPTAVSQVVEAAGKLLFGLVFAHLAMRVGYGPGASAAFAVLGLSVGTLLCFMYLLICQKWEKGKQDVEQPHDKLLTELLKVAFPVTLGAVLSGLSKMIDLSLIMRRLQESGVTQVDAVALYGCYSSMVVPLFGAVPALFGSLAMPLVPHLSHAHAKGDLSEQKQILQTAFRWGAAISVPAALGMSMLSTHILQLLFSEAEHMEVAVLLLLIISMAIPASCMITATSAVLQAYSHPWLPMLATAIGCALKAVSLYILCGIPQIGILAAPISTLLCCVATTFINLFFMERHVPQFAFSQYWLRAILASAASIGIAAPVCRFAASRVTSATLRVGAVMAVAVLIYLPIAYLCGLVRTSDIGLLRLNKEKEQ